MNRDLVPDSNFLPIYQQLKSKLTFPMSWLSGDYRNFDEWKTTARKVVMDKLIHPRRNISFVPRILEEVDRGPYVARKVEFQLTAEDRVPALTLVPKGRGPFPAILLLHDHGAKFDIGKEKLIEPWGDGQKLQSAKDWTEKCFSGYFIGNELVERGYLVLAIDAFGWSDRGVVGYENQQALAANLLNLGSSLAGLMAYEDVRSADFLATLAEVDRSRIGAIGFSMGAYRAWQVAALSDTVKVAAAVCWMGTIQGLMVPGNNILRGQSSFYMTHPGLVNYLDYPDVASLAAPKPMLFYNGGLDKLFPEDTVEEAYIKMKKVWESQRAGKHLKTKIWPDLGHVFVKEQQDAVFQWLNKYFRP